MSYSLLDKQELIFILETIDKISICNDKISFQNILLIIKDYINADTAISAIAVGEKTGANEELTPEIVNGNYSHEWLEAYSKHKLHLTDPTILYNFEVSGTQIWENTYKRYNEIKTAKQFVSLAEDHKIYNGISTGMIDKEGVGTIIAFNKNKIKHPKRHIIILNCLNHHLHQALKRICTDYRIPSNYNLTPRETEIMKWMKEGKTNWEISAILNVSEHTINFHIKNIIVKFDASNKFHALAIAMEHQILN